MPDDAAAEGLLLRFLQQRQAQWSEAKANWMTSGRADPQIDAGLAVTDYLLANLGKRLAGLLQDPFGVSEALQAALAEQAGIPEFEHFAYLTYGEYVGYIRGVRDALQRPLRR